MTTKKSEQEESANSFERLVATTREYEGVKEMLTKLTADVVQASAALQKKQDTLQNLKTKMAEVEAHIRAIGKGL